MAEHDLRHFKIGDHAFPKRTNGDNVPRRSPQHAASFFANRDNLLRHLIYCNDRWFVEYNPLAFDVHQHIGGAQIYTNVP